MGCLFRLVFDLADGGNTLIRNVAKFLLSTPRHIPEDSTVYCYRRRLISPTVDAGICGLLRPQ